MVIDTTQKLGWRHEVDGDGTGTIETDPISSASVDPNDRYWKFGINANKFTFSHPIEQHNWVPTYKGNHRYADSLTLIQSYVSEVIAFYPVNLIPFYQVLGNHSESAGVHTITVKDTGALETLTIRSESTGGTDAKYISAVGNKIRSLGLSFDLYQQFSSVSMTLTYEGINNVTPTLNSAHNGTKYPTTDATMSGTEVKERFKYDTNFAFHWDSSGSNEDFSSELRNFNCQIINNMNIEGVENQYDREYIDEGTYSILFGFQLFRGDTSEIYTDFLAATQHDFYITIYAGSTNYMTLTFDDVGLNMCQANYAKFTGENREEPVWNVMGIAENITVTGKDGLTAAACQTEYYGEATP